MSPTPEKLQDKVLRLSSTAHGIIPITSIYVAPDRMRTDEAGIRKYIDEELCPSIAEHGLIQPITVNLEEGLPVPYTHKLIAGWTRMQAFLSLGCDYIPFNLRENLSAFEQAELELEENLRRRNMRWQDICVGIAKAHDLKSREAHIKGEKWGQRQTGALIGQSHGYVNEALRVAQHIKKNDEEILNAPSFSVAKDILLKRKEDQATARLAKLTGAVPVTKASNVVPMGPRQGIDITAFALSDSTPSTSGSPAGPLMQSIVENVNVKLSDMLFNMDNKEFFDQTADESFDFIYTDIPYGIDMDNLDFGSDDLERVREAHDVDENVDQMLPFLQNSFRVLKDGRYLAFWYDLAHHEKLLEWGKSVGFSVQPYPIVWCKEHPCRNRAGNIWVTKAHETCFVMRKGQGVLNSPMTKSYILADGSAERKLQKNPFSKPFAVSKEIIQRFVLPGSTMLDPYAGEGSLVRAGLNLGVRVTAVEKEKHHFDHLTIHVKDIYNELTRGKVVFS